MFPKQNKLQDTYSHY